MGLVNLSLEDIQEFVDGYPDYIHVIGLLVPYRPGVQLFMVRTEYEIFTPDTPQNRFFHLHTLTWIECLWGLFSVPKSAREMVERVAHECGVRFVGDIPTIIRPSGIEQFPIQGSHVFNLENIKDHPVYRNDPETLNKIREKEETQMRDIMVVHRHKVFSGEKPRAH